MEGIRFNTPCKVLISGPSQSGKSVFTADLLRNADELFTEKVDHILFCYQEMQELFEELESELSNITFKKGVPTQSDLYELSSSKKHTILCLDDLMSESHSSSFIEHIFCVLSHHLKISVLLINQNTFYQGKNSRTISLQVHYFVLFPNNRDRTQIKTLARQISPGQIQGFMEIYNDCVSKPYSYLVIDTAPNSDQKYKFRTNIIPGKSSPTTSEMYPVVYRIL